MMSLLFRRAVVRSGVFGLSLALATTALSGPVRDFEAALRAAYADYRAALFQTNARKAAESEEALARLTTRWAALRSSAVAAPPPHYADDPAFGQTLTQVSAIASAAMEQVKGGALAEAHETLEAIRDAIGDLRSRNGIITFSDRMNAYHAKMETILGTDYRGFTPETIAMVREDAAVLVFLMENILAHPAPEAADPAYAPLVAGLKASVVGLSQAARSGDPMAVRRALEGLKVPYSKLFLKFG